MDKYIKNRNLDTSWDFLTANTKEYTHCYHTYPARMIPQIARRLLTEFMPTSSKLLFDPYCGTGTSLVEANLLGIENIGTDLNPLARLISKVKNTRFDSENIKNSISDLEGEFFTFSINGLPNVHVPTFNNIDFWFSQDIKNKLSIIQHLINNLPNEIKELFLIPFSETIREGSYIRNS